MVVVEEVRNGWSGGNLPCGGVTCCLHLILDDYLAVYQILLNKKYLTGKVMPLLAALAVALCTTMVLVVWSVMGGFLSTLLAQGRAMMGDVAIHWPTTGFAHYDELIRRLEEDKSMVAGATPVIETLAMASLPDNRIEGVQVKGIDAASYARVVDFDQTLWWRPMTEALPRDVERRDPRLDPRSAERLTQALADARAMARPMVPGGPALPAAITGIEVTGFSRRSREGFYNINEGLLRPQPDGGVKSVASFAPDATITLRMVPFDDGGREVSLVPGVFPIANEFRTGVYDIDKRTVFVEFKTLQRMLNLNGGTVVTRDQADNDLFAAGSPKATGVVVPARATTVLVRAAAGVSPDALRAHCTRVYRQFAAAHVREVPPPEMVESNNLIRTWEMQNATLVGAVKKETAMVLLLLWLISFVASFLILAIFWAMISEKTKDIGTLRAIGASGAGVAGIWIIYGLVIGVIGSVLGVALACVIVVNINPIHEWLGTALGLYVWDPRVYYFTQIPSKVEPVRALVVGLSGVMFSLAGAIVPAVRAAAMKPVSALRFE